MAGVGKHDCIGDSDEENPGLATNSAQEAPYRRITTIAARAIDWIMGATANQKTLTNDVARPCCIRHSCHARPTSAASTDCSQPPVDPNFLGAGYRRRSTNFAEL
jgi:hypothetical protein